MSSVISAAPKGSDARPSNMPPANSETFVTAAPNSTSATPRSRSSSDRQDMPVATGEATMLFTSRCAERTHISRLRRGLPSASRSEEHTSELQSLMRISYAVFCLKKQKQTIVYIVHVFIYIIISIIHKRVSFTMFLL